jgi:CheY-like chemotaxis protein
VVDKDQNRAANLDHMVAEARQSLSRGASDHEQRPVPARTLSNPTAAIDPKTLHILVVEDNIVNQKVLVKQLAKVGCTVSAANNGVEALLYLEKTEFQTDGGAKLSVILMDLEMPEMDGLTCVRRIREMEQSGQIRGHVPTIAVTANVRDVQVQEAKGAGMVRSESLFCVEQSILTASPERRRLETLPHPRAPRQNRRPPQRRCW